MAAAAAAVPTALRKYGIWPSCPFQYSLETTAFQMILPPKPKRNLKMEIQLHHKNSSRLEKIGCCTRTEEVEIKAPAMLS